MTLEKLLNILCEKGWKPFGYIVSSVKSGAYTDRYFFFEGCADGRTLREITSKSSGLWQFVCENKLVKPQVYAWYFYREGMGKEVCKEDYEFRLIESALKDESELEQFLLDNIKVE